MTVLHRAKFDDQAATTKSNEHPMPTNLRSDTHSRIQIPSAEWCDDTSNCRTAQLNFDITDALLAEVDFKWLMAGQEHRVDPKRFYADPAYTMDLLQTGMRSESTAVRECAAYLFEMIEDASTVHRPHGSHLELAFNGAEFSPGTRPVLSLSDGRTAEGRRQANQSGRF